MRQATTIVERPTIRAQLFALVRVLVASIVGAGVLVAGYRTDRLLGGFYVLFAALTVVVVLTATGGFRMHAKEILAQGRLFAQLVGRELWSTVKGWTEDSHSWRVLESWRKAQFVSPASEDAEIFLAAMQRNLARPAVIVDRCASIAVSLGLLGTACGLSAMLVELQTVAAAGDLVAGDGGGALFAQLFGDGSPLSQLGAAFATTVVGLALRLVFSNVAHVLQDGAERITDHLADACAVNVGPGIREAS